MLLALALIPVIVLLIVIFVIDKKEKEPIGLLIGLFFAGAATIITAVIGEAIGELILGLFMYDSAIKSVILSIFVVGPAEELGKFFVLWLITWKNKHFNYSYDAIVYAVFVSLGFACFENVGYVFMYGLGTALLRMFTAVPGHACYAVFMGLFYSKAKKASLTQGKKGFAGNMWLAILIPIITHGIYDAIILGSRETDYDIIAGIGALFWIAYVIAMFVVCIIIIVKASKNDYCIVTMPNQVQTFYKPAVLGSWNCSCGTVNNLNFCSQCGKPRPLGTTWNCPRCGVLCTFNFCGNCGSPKPQQPTPVPQ